MGQPNITSHNLFLKTFQEGKFVVLDTETTGLDNHSEIIQIAVIDPAGKVLLDTLIQPVNPIPDDATVIHGIDDDMVADAPMWKDVRPELMRIIDYKSVVTYNATYDRHMMHRSDETNGLGEYDYHARSHWHCAMEWYAALWGEFDGYHANPRWQRLSNALVQQGLQPSDSHRALGDALMTLALMKRILGTYLEDGSLMPFRTFGR